MKWLIILLLIVAAFVLVAVRYRRQIQTGIYLWRMFRKMRGGMKNSSEKQVQSSVNANDAQLVRCARCGTWTPQSEALNLRGKVFYCSSNCMENAVKVA